MLDKTNLFPHIIIRIGSFNRQQTFEKVFFDNSKSDWVEFYRVVPQAMGLGPLLFPLSASKSYVVELVNNATFCSMLMLIYNTGKIFKAFY